MTAVRTTRVGGVRIAYTVTGDPDAPPLVLLHALGERGSDWAPVLRPFGERFRVVAPDLRGHGDTDRPGAYTLGSMRDDVLGLLDHLGMERVVLAGHSMGGVVALLVAMHAPARIQRLVIEDATPPYVRERPLPERPDGPLGFDWDVVPAIAGEVGAGDPRAWAGLVSITAPTLLVGGGPDSHLPQDLLADAAERIPHCDLVTIAAGHRVHAERPAEFARTVLDWLDGDAS